MYALDPQLPTGKIKDDTDDKAVQTALKLIQNSYTEKSIRDNKNYWIERLFEEGFDVYSPDGAHKVNAQLLYQALWRTIQRMKPLDFEIHGSGVPQWMESIVTAGVATVLERGGYISALRDKGGAFYQLLMYGDSFIHIGTNPEDQDIPLLFNPISNSNVYVDQYATAIRMGTNSDRSASKVCVIFSYSWAEFCAMYPKFKNKAAQGQIPRELSDNKELERTYQQTTELDDIMEVAYFYDISNKNYTVFAGPMCTILDQKSGDDYPFMLNKKPYIPVIQNYCMPSMAGFYNHGLGDMLFRLANIMSRLFNLASGHVLDNTHPITLVNLPKAEATSFFAKLKAAEEMRAQGKRPFVATAYDPNSPGSSQVSANALITPSLFQEWQAMWEQFTREIQRLGINLDELDRGNVTATQVLAEEEAQSAFVKQIMENNASEAQFAIDVTMDLIEHGVRKSDKTPLNLTTTVEVEGVEIRPDDITLGMLADELKTNHYFVKVNSRSGAIPSNIAAQTKLARVLQSVPPGSPAQLKLLRDFARLNDTDIALEDIGLGQQPQLPQGGGDLDNLGEVPVSETDRISPNPRSATPQPAI